MSTIQSLKNFIRHGKQAHHQRTPPDQATTYVSREPVHAEQHRTDHHYSPAPHGLHSEPNIQGHQPLQGNADPRGDFSAPAVDGKNVAAQAHHAAADAADRQQRREAKQRERDRQAADSSTLQQIVAEEREAKGRLPRYPGLERYHLIEKMGDGAFSNVYKAIDTEDPDQVQVAIKVVRKFEMNNVQVRVLSAALVAFLPCFMQYSSSSYSALRHPNPSQPHCPC
jgi:serine/threonine-protein kinase RCK2